MVEVGKLSRRALLGRTAAAAGLAAAGMVMRPTAAAASGIRIACWGDSLTEGAGGDGVTYPGVLAELTGRFLFNGGVGGWPARPIGSRAPARAM